MGVYPPPSAYHCVQFVQTPVAEARHTANVCPASDALPRQKDGQKMCLLANKSQETAEGKEKNWDV